MNGTRHRPRRPPRFEVRGPRAALSGPWLGEGWDSALIDSAPVELYGRALFEPLAEATPLAAPVTVIDALPMPVDLLLYRGDDFFLDIDCSGPEGEPADLDGYSAAAQVRRQPDDADVMAEFECWVEDSTVGLHLPHLEAQKLVPGASAWDCQLSGPVVLTLVYGRVVTTPDVTRP